MYCIYVLEFIKDLPFNTYQYPRSILINPNVRNTSFNILFWKYTGGEGCGNKLGNFSKLQKAKQKHGFYLTRDKKGRNFS